MAVSEMVALHLPYLRRFARTLCGNQPSGDAYVRAFLEVLIEDPDALPRDLDPRVATYQTFLRLWNMVGVNLATEPPSTQDTDPVDRKLENIAPLPRQAFLLRWVEAFSAEETAQVLGATLSEVQELIDTAGREIAGEVATSVLIIEDEPIIAMNLSGIVESLGHSVTAVARTHAEAVRAAKRQPPGLVLADIQLADESSGVDAVNELLKYYEIPVIFITAYPERLLTGRRPEPTFLIPKPYDEETVKAIISQALFFDNKAQSHDRQASSA
jgi:CheY-like chemotaxis protein